MRIRPFNDGDTFVTFQALSDGALREIDSLENEYVLKASPTELEEYYVSKVTITPITLDVDNHYIEDQEGTQIDVSHHFDRMSFRGERIVVKGTRLKIAIPYTGDKNLWRIRPSTFSLSGYPELEVREDVVVFSTTFPDDSADAERLKKEIQNNLRSLSGAVENLRRDVENHNRDAPEKIRTAIARRRSKSESAIGAVSALGIPIKQRAKPPTFTAPTKRRVAPTSRPAVAKEKYEPEPVLEEKEFEHILNILKDMSLVIERSPSAFATLNEESIRTHFLLQLNGHYEGTATGETFNASGKTDILIRVKNRNIFIAECKFWRGQKSFSDAVDQLLSYLSWRDSKCALLIFNRTKDSNAVRAKMHETMEDRQECRKVVEHRTSGDSRYIFVKASEPGREIQICTMLFDFPTEDDGSA